MFPEIFAPYLKIVANIGGQPYFSATESTVLEGFGREVDIAKEMRD